MPLLEMTSVVAAISHGQHTFGSSFSDVDDALEFLLSDRDPWLRACATFSLGSDSGERYADHVRRLAEDRHIVVREAAELIRGQQS